MFSCLLCRDILFEPTTLICGHTFCKCCFLKDKERICRRCNEQQDERFPVKVDVLLSGQLKKYFPIAYKAAQLRNEGNIRYSEGDYPEAVKLYSEAISFAPLDHIISGNKSATSVQWETTEVVKGSDKSCQLQPHLPMSYFKRGYDLMLAGKYEESLISLLQCLSLDSTFDNATKTLAKVLQRILSPTLPTSETSERLESELCSVSVCGTSKPISIISSDLDDLASAIEFSQQSMSDRICQRSSGEISCQSSDEHCSESTGFLAGSRCTGAGRKSAQRKRRHSDPLINKRLILEDVKLSLKKVKGQLLEVPEHFLDRNDYDCSLCYRLLHEPATTSCGHTFCSGCLNRCLDHRPECPLCKESLSEYLANKKLSVNVLVKAILKKYFKEDVEERNQVYAKELEELRGATTNQIESLIPIFVCTIAFPTIPCPLYIFEPRYKLMMRQCMESGSKQFGMCLPTEQNGFSDYGCMLEIQEVQLLIDGRSAISTVGVRRFKVLSRGMRDGYNTATVQFIQDEKLQDFEICEFQTLNQAVHAEAVKWFNSLSSNFRSKITRHYGSVPALLENLVELSDGPSWIWWLLIILPISQQLKLQCLSMTSSKGRLLVIQRCLQELSNL